MSRLPTASLTRTAVLLAGDRQERLGVCASNCEKRARRTAGLFPPLLPALQGANRHAKQCGELRLRQASALPCLDRERQDDLSLARLHFAYGLEQLSRKVTTCLIGFEFCVGQ